MFTMRVAAGEVGGCLLKSPKGSLVRPTTGLVREAIFSMLGSIDSGWSRVLDLYAGTGSLGIEALSRGAGWADFVERDSRCCALIRENLERTKLAGLAKVHCHDAAKAIFFLKGEYDIVFLDPPYSDRSMAHLLEQIARSQLVGEGTSIVAQHSQSLASEFGKFGIIRSRRYGDTRVSFYRMEVRP